MVVGVTGKKEHGKDSFAALVRAYDTRFQILRFADDLKLMASKIFNIDLALMHSTAGKTFTFPEPVKMDDYLSQMTDVTQLFIQPKSIEATTLRQLLQFFGTDYVRSVEDLYWVNRVTSKIVGPTLVPDTRFLNEEKGLRDIGGKIVRINRIDAPTSTDSHKSETEMDLMKVDVTLDTVTGKYILQEMAAQFLSQTASENESERIAAYAAFESFDSNLMNSRQGYGNITIDRMLTRYYE